MTTHDESFLFDMVSLKRYFLLIYQAA